MSKVKFVPLFSLGAVLGFLSNLSSASFKVALNGKSELMRLFESVFVKAWALDGARPAFFNVLSFRQWVHLVVALLW
jgi:hypothetical protein